MKFTICRLKGGERGKRRKMMIETVMDDAFKNFGDEIEIRNGAIAGKIFSW